MKNAASHMTLGILAGGRSTRMGRNKAELSEAGGGGTFLEHLILLGSLFNDVIVSEDVPGRYQMPGVRTVADEKESFGPVEGIMRILSASWTEYAVIVATDMPRLTGELLEALAAQVQGTEGCVVLTKEGRPEPLCSVYSRKTLPQLREMMEEGIHRPRHLFDRVETRYVAVEELGFDPVTVSNVNTPEEYSEYAELAGMEGAPADTDRETAGERWFEGPDIPPVFGICGTKKTGKTTIMMALVKKLTERGYEVAAIKHDGHDFEPDTPGTDSFFVRRSGAATVAVFSDAHVSYNQDLEGATPKAVLKNLLRVARKRPDIVLVEGLKHESHPKLDLNKNSMELTESNFEKLADHVENTYLKKTNIK